MTNRKLSLLLTLHLASGCAQHNPPSPSGDLLPAPVTRPLYGNEGGNGGDTLSPENGSAWFLTPVEAGERKYVSICFEKGADFKAPDAMIRKAISTAVDDWEVYVDFKGVSLVDGKHGWKPTVAYMPSVVSNAYASDPSAIPNHCRGDESLKLFFGATSSSSVDRAKTLYRHPLAFAYRESFELQKGWGRGVIWVAEAGQFGKLKAWDEAGLTTIVAHELGHVLGCDHVSGTIMRKDILEFLEAGHASSSPLIPFKINRERELLLSAQSDLLRPAVSRNGETNVYKSMYDSVFGTTLGNSHADDLLFYGHLDVKSDARALQAFWGSPLAKGHTRLFEKVERRVWPDSYELVITFKDDETTKTYVVKTSRSPIQSASEAKVFQLALGSLHQSQEGGASEIFTGQVTAGDGKTYPVLVQRNSVRPLAGLAIWFTDGNVNYPLFYPDPHEGLWTNLLE